MEDVRKLDLDDALRADANKLLKAEKKMSFSSRAKAAPKDGFETVKETCFKNGKLCAAMGVTGYLTYKSYQDLSEEEKQCNNICMPDDWVEFKKGRKARPTYKTEDAVSPYDPSLKYEALYPDNADTVCTVTNMMDDGINPAHKDSCDKFCQNVCGFTLDDVLLNTPSTSASLMKELFGDTIGELFGDSTSGMIASGVSSLLIIVLVVFIIMFIK
jgi:hypothetical protein